MSKGPIIGLLIFLLFIGLFLGSAHWVTRREIPFYIKSKQEAVRYALSNETIKKLRDSTWGKEIDFDLRSRPDWLLYWLGLYLEYANPKIPSDPRNALLGELREREDHLDPLVILQYGVGRCEEFSIVYAAFLKAAGRDVRIVYDYSTGEGNGDHVWVEVDWLPPNASHDKVMQKIEDGYYWCHIDPTEGAREALRIVEYWEETKDFSRTLASNKFIDYPEMYEKAWGKEVNNAWAVHPDYCKEVTDRYQWEE